jgi:hypothetical protein
MNALTACQALYAASDAEAELRRQHTDATRLASEAFARFMKAVAAYSATQPTRVTIAEAVAACPACCEADGEFTARTANAARTQRWVKMAMEATFAASDAFIDALSDGEQPETFMEQVKAEPARERSMRATDALFSLAAKWTSTNPLDRATI